MRMLSNLSFSLATVPVSGGERSLAGRIAWR
jgi:hypothetical protein